MLLNLVYANNPQWSDNQRQKINLVVRFAEISEDLPFTADPNDSADHGRDIFSRAVAGEFGVVADPPTEPNETDGQENISVADL